MQKISIKQSKYWKMVLKTFLSPFVNVKRHFDLARRCHNLLTFIELVFEQILCECITITPKRFTIFAFICTNHYPVLFSFLGHLFWTRKREWAHAWSVFTFCLAFRLFFFLLYNIIDYKQTCPSTSLILIFIWSALWLYRLRNFNLKITD